MTEEGDEAVPVRIVGLSLSDAVDAVVARDDRDPETVRTTLERVTEDGVVSRAAVESELGHLSKVVATPETRVELAAMALDDAREAAEPVSDLGAVRSRLEGFEARLAAVEQRVAGLGGALQALVQFADDSTARADEYDPVYEVAAGIRRVTTDANAAQQAADELAADIEEFEAWVTDQDRRLRELDADLDALAESQDGLEGVVETVANAEDPEAATDDPADASDDAGEATDDPARTTDDAPADPARTWFDATLRHRVLGLLHADLRAEYEEFRTWAERESLDAGWTARVEDRLDRLRDRQESTGERLADLARPAWTDRYGERVSAIEAALDEFEPPVAWSEVQGALDEQRTGAEG